MMRFEWDEKKDLANFKKHNIAFDEAKRTWADPHSQEWFDVLHSVDEDRFVRIGFTPESKLLVVFFTEHQDQIRIISARPATPAERMKYEEGI